MLVLVISLHQIERVELIKLYKTTKLSYKITKLYKVIELLYKVTKLCNVIDNKNFSAKL